MYIHITYRLIDHASHKEIDRILEQSINALDSRDQYKICRRAILFQMYLYAAITRSIIAIAY